MTTIKPRNGTFREASPCDKCGVTTAEIHKRAIIKKHVAFVCESCYYSSKLTNVLCTKEV